MKNFSDKIVDKIKKENVQPYSKWHFIIRRFLIWTLFVLSLILGSLACGVVIFQLRHADWDLYPYLNMDYGTFVLLNLPYFWLIFLLVFMGVAFFYCRRTERGYRCPTAWLIMASVIFSLVGGFVAYKVDLAERLEVVFRNNVRVYRVLQERKAAIWLSPDKGLLAGKIVKIISDKELKFKDLKGRMWKIDVSHARWRGFLKASVGLKIKIIGKMAGNNCFVVKEVRPWQGRGWGRLFHMGAGRRRGRFCPADGHPGMEIPKIKN